jgi:hypothetical protein
MFLKVVKGPMSNCTAKVGSSSFTLGITDRATDTTNEGGLFSASEDVIVNPKSEKLLHVIKDWIGDCIQHPLCNAGEHSFVPTRLIKLGDDDLQHTYLCEPTTPVQYAALSYCWGTGGGPSSTKRKNLSLRGNKLEVTNLPQTLQDAVFVTRGLGLEYLWIDALCIVQDDNEEWAKEASSMADVYSSAHVVLSATATDDCTDGFLQKREEPLVMQCTYRDGEHFEVSARLNNSHDCSVPIPVEDFTLFRRGWCMQERSLARRIVHFLPHEVRFECQERQTCECSYANQEDPGFSAFIGSLKYRELRAASELDEFQFACKWMGIVADYSEMELTRAADRLPALSGFAACMEHLKPGRYISGLWEYGLLFQLCWQLIPSVETHGHASAYDRRRPTFSWISQSRPVYGIGSQIPEGGVAICIMEGSGVELATTNRYGEVNSASITLRGKCIPGDELILFLKRIGRVSWSSWAVLLDLGFASLNEEIAVNDGHHRVYAGIENAVVDWSSVICFGVVKIPKKIEMAGESPHDIQALLLQRTDTAGSKFIRIGLLNRLDFASFDEHAKDTTVTIV